MSRWFFRSFVKFLSSVSVLLLTAFGVQAGLDAPHDVSTATGCLSCHHMTSTYPKLLPPLNHTPLPGDIDDTISNGSCWTCHNDIKAPYVLTHSSLATSAKYGDWTVECWVCHNQHMQEQDRYNGSSYGKYIRRAINLANIKGGDGNTLGKTGIKSVKFLGQTGPNSFADGDPAAINGICEVCHTDTSAWHSDGTLAGVTAHSGLKGSNCMTCHPHSEGFRADYDCLDCHENAINDRAAVGQQFSGNSHHVQTGATVTSDKCYQCHWEADAAGKLTSRHSATTGAAVDLVIYGAGVRPTDYNGSTAVAYTADGSRAQILSLNSHCLGCHDEDTKGIDIFTDGKAPNYYAWDESSAGARDGSSVNARYSRTETTNWGKYSPYVYQNVENKYEQTKSYSAHGKASTNQRGWNSQPWEAKASTPDTIYSGAELVSPGAGDYIYAARGNGTTAFYRYSLSSDSWTTLAAVPGTLSVGADLAAAGNYIYALRSNYTQDFYRYSISDNSWATMAPVPAGPESGGALVYPGSGDYIYATRGLGTPTLYRYSISGNSWSTMANAPGMIYYGADLVYPGAGDYIYASQGYGTATFSRYSISGNSWSTMASAPVGFSDGGTLASTGGGDYIYALPGGAQANFYRYSISANVWTILTPAPQSIAHGGSLVYPGSGNYLYALRGSFSTSFYRYRLGDLWLNTSGTAQVACFDCHNSHGSSAGDADHPAASYASATPSGGILKDTTQDKGGYAVSYTPAAGGSAGEKNVHNPGAGLCFDCHLNANGSTADMPWGYQSTFGANQAIMGYRDTAGFGNGAFGYQQKYQYKIGASMGGHFGRSADLSAPPDSSHQINGLCTPCHDPHGVSPSLGADAPYAVPLLKGTFMTSPYREDAAPASTNVSFGGGGPEGSGGFNGASYPAYNIDQNTFANWNWGSTTKIGENVNRFGGLCLKCHPQSVLNPDAGASNYPWRSMNRVHNTVKGWGGQGLNAGNAKHAFTCSKCHTVHNSQLPRLMITNCLDYSHRGRVTSGGAAGIGSGAGSGSSGSGSGGGRFPSGGSGSGGGYDGGGGGWSGFGAIIACHDGTNGDGWPNNQRWNDVTQWSTCLPLLTAPPSVTGAQQQTVLLHMDEALWNGTAGEVQDSSGSNNHGTAYFGATTVAGGISGNAGSFSGAALPTGSHVSITYAPPMDNFTLEAWIKPTTTHEVEAESTSGTGGTFGERYVFGADQRGPVDGGAGVSAGTNGISVYEHGDGYMPALAVYSGAISNSQWTHVVVVYANKRPSIYVNGVLVRTGLQSLRQHVIAPTTIGSGSYGGFPGTIDEVAIYDTPLSAADILLHYQQNSASYICGGTERTITWSTSCGSTSYVDYGPTTGYGQTAGDALPVTNHSVTLSSLSIPATYHYRVRSANADGEAVSGDYTFTMNTCP